MQPNNNGVGAGAPVSATAPKEDIVFRDKPKKNTGMTIGMIILALLAAGGIGFGVWAYLSGNQKEAKLNEQVSELQSQLAERPEVVDDVTSIDIAGDAANYIYVGEWGLKIKIPETLSSVSYRYSYEAGFTKVSIWGVDCSEGKCQAFPEYADTSKNNSGMGSIARYPKGQEFNEGSAPTLVFSDDTYDYYQFHIQLPYSADLSEQESNWEMESIKIIDDMLSSSDNYSAI